MVGGHEALRALTHTGMVGRSVGPTLICWAWPVVRKSEATCKSPWALRQCPRGDQKSLKVFNRAGYDVWIRETKTGAGRQVVMVLARDSG